MSKVNHETCWIAFKEQLIQDYFATIGDQDTDTQSVIEKQLQRMDELDGTYEFTNLKHDLKAHTNH